VAVADNYAYITTGWSNTLYVVDVSNHAAPFAVGVGPFDMTSLAYPAGVAVAGNDAYVAAGNEGLRVILVSNPSAPVAVGFYNTPAYATGVTVVAGHAYVADSAGGFFILQYAPAAYLPILQKAAP
jgi:hypothetical protein